MLFFSARRKEKNESISKIPLILDKLWSVEKLQEEQWKLQQENYQTLLTRQRKSEVVIENILEVLDEYKTILEEQNSARSKEKVLVGYISAYDGSLHQLERMFRNIEGKEGEWVKQLEGIKKQLRDNMEKSELKIIKEQDITVDFNLHEVVGICDTEQKEKDGQVCEVIIPGMIFEGNVVNKAKVTAYQYKGEENAG
ncbi:nucleotide exchange factor GrpE [Muricomes intestini]|jgi:molecular chaperone GrpE (heat shock protein)|uniref:nucleotide exchange factor GrpE n=1 Tax=Muricomes intestini TaxID=1796634 RepID=UPI000E910612|nr:nucleotide exchange factor GrpE [Lachnospiraceae bacterium]